MAFREILMIHFRILLTFQALVGFIHEVMYNAAVGFTSSRFESNFRVQLSLNLVREMATKKIIIAISH